MEPRLGQCPNQDKLGTPDILLMVSEEVVAFDNLQGSLQLIVHAEANDAGYAHAQSRLQELTEQLRKPVSVPVVTAAEINESDFVFESDEKVFKESVNKAKQYIIDGDIMQVVLSQRSSVKFDAPPLNLYRALRNLNPSPYMYFFESR